MFDFATLILIGGFLLVITFLRRWFFAPEAEMSEREKIQERLFTLEKMPPRDFTVEELKEFDGTKESLGYRLLMAVNGYVLDVSKGYQFYGPGGPYAVFAGRDASRGFAQYTIDESVLSDVYDDLSDLNEEERQMVEEWHQSLSLKYATVGNLVESY